MSQNFQLGLLGQAVTVNATTNAVSVNSSVNATAFSIGTSFIANTTGVTIANTGSMLIGNTTVNTYVVPASISINGTTLVANTTGAYHTGTINAASHTTTGVTANATGVFLANTAQFYAGNATINTSITSYSATFGTNTVTIGTSAYFIANGNVGIGISAPSVRLDLVGSQYWRGAAAAGAVGVMTPDPTSGANGVNLAASFATGGYGPLTFSTSATERMRIDSSGRVTMPYQPCFWAYAGASNPTLTGTATALVFTSATTNVGSYYSIANGRFTAPVAGTYLFNWTIAQSGTTGGPVAYLGKNGSTVSPGAIAYTIAYNTGSMSAIITLAANDYVQVLAQAFNATSPVIDMNWSSFSGHLIG